MRPKITAFGSRVVANALAHAFLEQAVCDSDWDEFLAAHSLGHFQQSSIWARIKAHDGWEAYRVVVRTGAEVLGGFQVLYRNRRGFREAYLNKGPVCMSEDPELVAWLLELVDQSLRLHRIQLLVAQTPDEDVQIAARLPQAGYLPNGIASLITATLCVPLSPDLESATGRVRKSVRVAVRRAIARGVTLREGGSADLPVFFQLMAATCKRQNTQPNPSTIEQLGYLWAEFSAKGLARITMAECEGKPVASLLALQFGRRTTQWKKGWSGEFPERNPTTLLSYESIEWAWRKGATLVDFVGCDRRYAETLLSGRELSAEHRASRYFFLSGFGAEPVLLPEPQVLVINRVARLGYRIALPFLKRAFLN